MNALPFLSVVVAMEFNGIFESSLEIAPSWQPWFSKSAKRSISPQNALSDQLSIRGENNNSAVETKNFGMVGNQVLTATVQVNTQDALTENLESNITILLGDDILLTSTRIESPTGVMINNQQSGLVIDGLGLYEVNGQGEVRCFSISGSGVNVVIQNLVVTKGIGNGGGLNINEAKVLLKACTISSNNGIGDVANVGGGLYITSTTVSLISCAIINNKAHRGGGIELDDGQLLLAGCLFSGNNIYGASDLQLSAGSNVTVLSACSGGSYKAGQGTLECSGCSTTYPADLLSGECTPCPELDPCSCCGAQGDVECQSTTSSACSADETFLCSAVLAPQLAPSRFPTPLPLPVSTTTPTYFRVSKSSSTFTVLVVITSTTAIIIAIVLRWCFTSKTCQNVSPRKTGVSKEDFASPFLEASYNNNEDDFGPEYIYSPFTGSVQNGEDGKMILKSTSSEATSESSEIASTYGADQTIGSNADHGGAHADEVAPLDKIIAHLCRHGLEKKVSESVTKYLSASFGVHSVGDFRLLEEADIVRTAEDVELLKVQTTRLRIAWR